MVECGPSEFGAAASPPRPSRSLGFAHLAAAPAPTSNRRFTMGAGFDDAVISCVFGPPRGDGTAVGRPPAAARGRRRGHGRLRLPTPSGPTPGGWITPVGGGA